MESYMSILPITIIADFRKLAWAKCTRYDYC